MKKSVYIFLLFLFSTAAHAQSPGDSATFEPQYKRGINYTLKTRNGEIFSGFVKNETKDYVTLENRITHETIELKKSEIIRINHAKDYDSSVELLGENPHAKSYMFLSSAFEFEENKASTNSHWLLLENIDYAFTDNWAISLNTLAFYPVTIGIKCAYQISDNNYLGANIFGIGDITSGSSSSLLFGYGAQAKFTKGSSNKNITLSGGVLGLNAELFYVSPGSPFVNLVFLSGAYCKRFSKNVAFNLEGWYLPEVKTGLGGIGFKFIGDETTCWTVGCYALTNNYDNSLKLNLKTLPIPYFGVSRKFN